MVQGFLQSRDGSSTDPTQRVGRPIPALISTTLQRRDQFLRGGCRIRTDAGNGRHRLKPDLFIAVADRGDECGQRIG